MIGDFFGSFGKEKDEPRELPQEIVDILNKDLPDSFEYIIDANGMYRVVPRKEQINKGDIKITVQFDLAKVPELQAKLLSIPREKWDEYIYRTQTAVPIKSAQIGDEKKCIPVEQLSADPLRSEDATFIDGFISPDSFEKTITKFESPEGDVIQITIQQQAYDSLTEIKFINIDFPALKIELYRYSPLVKDSEKGAHTSIEQPFVATYSVTPSNALSVKDAVIALRIFRGLYNGTTKAEGVCLCSKDEKTSFDPVQIEDALNLWETLLKIEEKLDVKFNPGADFPNDDVQFLAVLKNCLLDGKAVLWRHPFDHFRANGLHPLKNDMSFEEFIGNESLHFEFLEGPIPATLLGAEFNLYSRTEMKDFIITSIDWNDESRKQAEIYISDLPDKQWSLTRLYLTDKQAEKYRKRNITSKN